jgi:acetylornithine deacetylase/succinyl-diaminopimelate desuccinylase-like protein
MNRLVWAALACTAIAFGQTGETAADLAARYLPELIRLDTANPPGNETRVARYLKQVADREGIPAELPGDDPERLNFVARLAMERVFHATAPNALVVPFMMRGATDGAYPRAQGMAVYGVPLFRKDGELRMHGNDERMSLDNLRTGTDLPRKIVIEVAKP